MCIAAVDVKSFGTETFVAAVYVDTRLAAVAVVHQAFIDVLNK